MKIFLVTLKIKTLLLIQMSKHFNISGKFFVKNRHVKINNIKYSIHYPRVDIVRKISNTLVNIFAVRDIVPCIQKGRPKSFSKWS